MENGFKTTTGNCYPGRNGYPPEIVVLHLTEGNADGAKEWFHNPASDASSTVIIRKSGEVIWIVAEEDAPWTNGFRNGQDRPPTNPYVARRCWGKFSPNLITLSVEIEWFQSDGVIPANHPIINTLVRLLADWSTRYGLAVRERIMGHNEIDPTGKPFCGKHIPWPFLFEAVAALMEPVDHNTPSPWLADEWAAAKQAGITDGSDPKGDATREQVAAMILRGLKLAVVPPEK